MSLSADIPARPPAWPPTWPPTWPGGWDAHVHVFDGRPAPAAHYAAGAWPLAQIEATAAAHGVGRLVLVQPSVYGHDNALLLDALRVQPGRHRGVVVLGGHERDEQLDAMADAGVRGVRVNAVSPRGNAAETLNALAPRLRARGWHVQWYVPPTRWAEVAALSQQHGLVPVLDHLAGITPAAWARADLPLAALARLADLGAWLKLSGWYRLHSKAPFADLLPAITALQRQFEGRCVWGSDWPHTRYLEPGVPGPAPAYASLMAPAQAALGADAWRLTLQAAATTLYR